MTRCRRCTARGQTLVIFALCFALVLFSVMCLVADTAFLFRWSDRVQAAAQVAAESGADAVDPRFLYGACGDAAAPCHGFIVDISSSDRVGSLYAFQRACIETGDQSAGVPRNPPGDLTPKTAGDAQTPEGTACDSDGCRVFAAVTRVVMLPITFPGFPSSVAVVGTAYTAPVVGAGSAVSTCTGGTWLPSPP
jgi:hypothetical protein